MNKIIFDCNKPHEDFDLLLTKVVKMYNHILT